MSLSSYLKETGLDVTHHNTHSFKIRAATSTMAAGISDAHTKMLGHWKSNAYQLYIKTLPSQLASFSKTLTSVR